MKRCPNCGRWWESTRQGCPECGVALERNDVADDGFSSEDADDGVFQHRDTEAQRKQREHDEATAVPEV